MDSNDRWRCAIVIDGVTKIVIEVEDQHRAKAFWTRTTLGFELVQDTPYGEERWPAARTPDKATVVVLDVGRGQRPPSPTHSCRPLMCSSTPTTSSRPIRSCAPEA